MNGFTLPEVLAMAGFVITMVGAGIGYGRMSGRLDSLEETVHKNDRDVNSRIDKHEAAQNERAEKHERLQREHSDAMEKKLDGIRDSIVGLRVMLEGLAHK